MLTEADFSLDTIIMRQVKRAKEAEARGDDPDLEDDETPPPPGTQANRPQELESDVDEEEEEEDVTTRVKREKSKRLGRRSEPAEESDVDMED